MADWRMCLLIIVAIVAGISRGQDGDEDEATTAESTDTTPTGNVTQTESSSSTSSTSTTTSTTTTTTTTESPTTEGVDNDRPPELNRTDFLTGRFCTCDLTLGSCDVGCCCDGDCDYEDRQGGQAELGLEMPA